MADAWQEFAASAAALGSAALPWVIALAPLALGPLVLSVPSAADELTKFLKTLGWLK